MLVAACLIQRTRWSARQCTFWFTSSPVRDQIQMYLDWYTIVQLFPALVCFFCFCFCFALWLFKGKSTYITMQKYSPSGNSTSSLETLGLLGKKTNCNFYVITFIWQFLFGSVSPIYKAIFMWQQKSGDWDLWMTSK